MRWTLHRGEDWGWAVCAKDHIYIYIHTHNIYEPWTCATLKELAKSCTLVLRQCEVTETGRFVVSLKYTKHSIKNKKSSQLYLKIMLTFALFKFAQIGTPPHCGAAVVQLLHWCWLNFFVYETLRLEMGHYVNWI